MGCFLLHEGQIQDAHRDCFEEIQECMKQTEKSQTKESQNVDNKKKSGDLSLKMETAAEAEEMPRKPHTCQVPEREACSTSAGQFVDAVEDIKHEDKRRPRQFFRPNALWFRGPIRQCTYHQRNRRYRIISSTFPHGAEEEDIWTTRRKRGTDSGCTSSIRDIQECIKQMEKLQTKESQNVDNKKKSGAETEKMGQFVDAVEDIKHEDKRRPRRLLRSYLRWCCPFRQCTSYQKNRPYGNISPTFNHGAEEEDIWTTRRKRGDTRSSPSSPNDLFAESLMSPLRPTNSGVCYSMNAAIHKGGDHTANTPLPSGGQTSASQETSQKTKSDSWTVGTSKKIETEAKWYTVQSSSTLDHAEPMEAPPVVPAKSISQTLPQYCQVSKGSSVSKTLPVVVPPPSVVSNTGNMDGCDKASIIKPVSATGNNQATQKDLQSPSERLQAQIDNTGGRLTMQNLKQYHGNEDGASGVCPIHKEAAEFAACYKECIRVLAYGKGASPKVVTFYICPGNGGISESLKEEAEKRFSPLGVKLEWVDLFNDPVHVPCVSYPLGFKPVTITESAEIAVAIKKNLDLFSQHSNITGVFPSLKVKDFTQSSTPCIAVYVLGKGNIPWGEYRIPCTIAGFPVDVLEGFWLECNDDQSILVTQEFQSPLKLGVSIGREGVNVAGSLGALVEDEAVRGDVFALSCYHVLRGTQEKEYTSIVQPSLRDNVRALEKILDDYKERFATDFKKVKEKRVSTGLDDYGQWHKERLWKELNDFCTRNSELLGPLEGRRTKLSRLKEEFLEIYEEQPRKIATYADGLKGNVKINGMDRVDEAFYIDAGIAKLEVPEIQWDGLVQLASGPKTPPSECLKLSEIVSGEAVRKCGRTTESTKGFILSRDMYLHGQHYSNIKFGCNKPAKSIFHVAMPRFYCTSCFEGQGVNGKPETANCARCGKEADCFPHYALRHDTCKSCAEERSITWNGAETGLPDRRLCCFCRNIEQCQMHDFHPQYLCESCAKTKNAQLVDAPSLKTFCECIGCRKEAKCLPYYETEEQKGTSPGANVQTDESLEQELQAAWCHNCLLIKGNPTDARSFAAPGDSGAVIFDSEGKAVGLLFACFFDTTFSAIYALACPMELVLKKLEEKTGRKLRLKTEFKADVHQ